MLPVPTLLDARYRVDRIVGEGGFGTVYAGEHLRLGTRIAVKILKAETPSRSAEYLSFVQEGKLLTLLHHPNIVTAIDIGFIESVDSSAPCPYLVMDWVDGKTVAALLHERGRLCVDEAWLLFEPLLDALAHAHEQHVVHRDLKPSNVMISTGVDGGLVPRIIDFGVAKVFEIDSTEGGHDSTTRAPHAFTMSYAAPEQVMRLKSGPWTDVHAAALIFFELVTGQRPYGQPETAGLRAVSPQRPNPRDVGVDVGAIEPVLAKALSLQPSERYRNAREMLDAMRAVMRSATTYDSPRFLARGEQVVAGEATVQRAEEYDPAQHVDPASEQSEHTELDSVRTPQPRVRRHGAFVRTMIALSLALVSTAAVAFTWAARSPKYGAQVALAPLSVAHRPLASLTSADIAAKLETLGIKADSYSDDAVVQNIRWQVGGEIWFLYIRKLPQPRSRYEALWKSGIVNELRILRMHGTRTVYAADDSDLATLTVYTNDTDPTKLFDQVFDSTIFDLRGSTFGENDPAAVEPRAGKASRGQARFLGEMSAAELVERFEKAGFGATVLTDDGPTMVTVTRQGAIGSVALYDRDLEVMRAGISSVTGTVQTAAFDGTGLLWIQGDTSIARQEILDRVLVGLQYKYVTPPSSGRPSKTDIRANHP